MAVKFQLASSQLPLIIVPVVVAGKNKQRIITAVIDTGATGCVMTQHLATDLDLPHLVVPKQEKSAHGIGGQIKVEFVRVKEINLDGVSMKNMRTAVMDLKVIHEQFSAIGIAAKKKVELIIGFPFFKGRKLIIDYKNKTLSIK